MPPVVARFSQSVIVGRLRAAGCVFAEDEARLLISAAQTPDGLAAMVEQRVGGVPLEHVVGWAEFCGLRIAVDLGVFVPRRRTEFLARRAAALGRQLAQTGHFSSGQPIVVVDLCCGSGAVGVVVAAALGSVELHAADVDPVAVRCARRNVASVAGRVYEGDLYLPLPHTLLGRVDLLIANAPYVPSDEIGLLPPEARIHEPRRALDGGKDGVAVLRRVAAEATGWLAPGGYLLVETSERQASRTVQAVVSGGLTPQVSCAEELNATVVTGCRPAPGADPAGWGMS